MIDPVVQDNSEPPLQSAFDDILNDTKEIHSITHTERYCNIYVRKWKSHTDWIKERTYDINLAATNMPAYAPLADEHLQDYFNSLKTRKHLLRLGLVIKINQKIDQEGNIIDEKLFKKNQIQLDKKEHEEKLLGQQLDRELNHDIEVIRINKIALRMQTKQVIEKRSRLRAVASINIARTRNSRTYGAYTKVPSVHANDCADLFTNSNGIYCEDISVCRCSTKIKS